MDNAFGSQIIIHNINNNTQQSDYLMPKTNNICESKWVLLDKYYLFEAMP